ncbi:MAG: hypothetical protein U0165_20330 [Polyangiaceae bacterium]
MSNAEPVTGTFEIHVFVHPLNPSAAESERFQQVCAEASSPGHRVKGLLLYLDFEGQGFVGVLQTSRYVQGSLDDAKQVAHEDAEMLRKAGFEVIREKIEAVATSDGVPKTQEEANVSARDRYFEFHILIESTGWALADDDMVRLRGISSELSQRWSRPVPLSYNAFKPGQRFLNVRAQGVGLDDAMKKVEGIEWAIRETGTLHVVKVISEYICSDTFRELDRGWLDPLSPS